MKAVQIVERSRVEFVEVDMPELQPGEALIRPTTISLCASDIFMLDYLPEDAYPQPPGSSGHELVGVVETLNGKHPEVMVGDLALAIIPDLYGMAEYRVAKFEDVLPVPKHVAQEHLVQAQQLGTVIYACKQLPNVIGKTVVVIGQGSAGQWFNTMLRRLGAKTIIGIDLLEHRLAISKSYDATHTVNNSLQHPTDTVRDILNGQLADIVVEAVGETETINLAIELTKPHGFLLQFGVPHEFQPVYNYYELFRKCLTLKAIVGAADEPRHISTRMALDMIASGEVDVRPLITHHFPFSRVPEAYNLQRSRKDGAIKIFIEMPTP